MYVIEDWIFGDFLKLRLQKGVWPHCAKAALPLSRHYLSPPPPTWRSICALGRRLSCRRRSCRRSCRHRSSSRWRCRRAWPCCPTRRGRSSFSCIQVWSRCEIYWTRQHVIWSGFGYYCLRLSFSSFGSRDPLLTTNSAAVTAYQALLLLTKIWSFHLERICVRESI